jgi:ABC-type sulfate transport system substrate-binding protein
MVALALPLDIDKIAAAGLLRPDWPRVYPNNSVGARAQ